MWPLPCLLRPLPPPRSLSTPTSCPPHYITLAGKAVAFHAGLTSPTLISIFQTKNPITYIQALLDLKDRFDHFLLEAFSNDQLFKRMISRDFEFFLNLNAKVCIYSILVWYAYVICMAYVVRVYCVFATLDGYHSFVVFWPLVLVFGFYLKYY